MEAKTTQEMHDLRLRRISLTERLYQSPYQEEKAALREQLEDVESEILTALNPYLDAQLQSEQERVEREKRVAEALRLGRALVKNQYSCFNPHANQFLDEVEAILERMGEAK